MRKTLLPGLLTLTVLLGLGLPSEVSAQVLKTVDFVFDINVVDPDPTVWAKSGNIIPFGDEGLGLQITDLGLAHSLLYFAATPEIAGQTNVSTFRGLVRTQEIQDSFVAAWDNDTTGFRLIVDDGFRRLVLALGRDPNDVAAPKRRGLVVLGASGVPFLPFPWNNGVHNVYEIGRLSDGNFSLSATNNNPLNTAPPVTVTIPAASLPVSTGAAMFAWGMGAAGGGTSFWQEVHGTVIEGVVEMGLDTSKLTFDLNPHHSDNEIEWRGELTLPAGTTIDPAAQFVSIALTSGGQPVFDTDIAPGHFVAHPNGGYRYQSPGGTPAIAMRLTPRGGSLWEFRLNVEDVLLPITDRTQITGTLAIGDKVGVQTMALIDKGKRLEFKKP